MKWILSLYSVMVFVINYGQISGEWHSSFIVMGTSLRLDLTITDYPRDPVVTLSDPDRKGQGANEMKEVKITDTTLSFSFTEIGLTFNGIYHRSGDSLYGKMNQMGIEWDVVFKREEQKKAELDRPQEPKGPFPYVMEELKIENGDLTLGATLTIPRTTSSSFPIVVLASGSGAQDRNCEIMGHKPFWVIADYLARNGIACLRFDDRGTGSSTGSFVESDLNDFGSDVKACVNYLKKDPRFKNNPIGIAGHSEGGMHALIASKKNKQVSFVIELASVGTSGREVLVEQQYLIPKKSGEPEEVAKWNSSLYDGLCEIISEFPQEKAVEPINAFLDSMYVLAPDNYKAENNTMNFKLGLLMLLNNQWARQFISFEAKDYLKSMKIPVLAMNGTEDIQVPPLSNQKGFENNFSSKSLQEGSKAILVPGVNHLFQNCTTCTVTEYGELTETFSEEAMKRMTEWIIEVSKD